MFQRALDINKTDPAFEKKDGFLENNKKVLLL